MTEGNASKDNNAMGITEFDDLTGPDQSALTTAPPAFNRRSVLFGASAAVIAATAAACAPAPAPTPAPTTTVPPTTLPPTTTSTLPPTTTTTQPGSAAGETAAQVLHVARRLSFGPTPELLGEIRAIGITAWIDQQLAWETIDNSSIDAILASYPRSLMTATEISAGSEPWRTRQEMAAATVARSVEQAPTS